MPTVTAQMTNPKSQIGAELVWMSDRSYSADFRTKTGLFREVARAIGFGFSGSFFGLFGAQKRKMRTRGKARPKLPPIFGMSGAQIREMRERVEIELEAFNARRPAMEAEAKRLGKELVTSVRQSSIRIDGLDVPIVYEQNLSYSFKRPEKLRKKQRPLCGARCRDGHSCEARVVVRPDGTLAARCKLHGGLSTGPKTQAGRAAIGAANRARAKPVA